MIHSYQTIIPVNPLRVYLMYNIGLTMKTSSIIEENREERKNENLTRLIIRNECNAPFILKTLTDNVKIVII